LLDPFRS